MFILIQLRYQSIQFRINSKRTLNVYVHMPNVVVKRFFSRRCPKATFFNLVRNLIFIIYTQCETNSASIFHPICFLASAILFTVSKGKTWKSSPRRHILLTVLFDKDAFLGPCYDIIKIHNC